MERGEYRALGAEQPDDPLRNGNRAVEFKFSVFVHKLLTEGFDRPREGRETNFPRRGRQEN